MYVALSKPPWVGDAALLVGFLLEAVFVLIQDAFVRGQI
jgi:hypothetical protein